MNFYYFIGKNHTTDTTDTTDTTAVIKTIDIFI